MSQIRENPIWQRESSGESLYKMKSFSRQKEGCGNKGVTPGKKVGWLFPGHFPSGAARGLSDRLVTSADLATSDRLIDLRFHFWESRSYN